MVVKEKLHDMMIGVKAAIEKQMRLQPKSVDIA